MSLIPLSRMEREALIIETMPAVRRIAGKIIKRLPSWIDIDDLISEGYIGLIKAARDFDAEKGKFRSYAGLRIGGAISDYLRSSSCFNRSTKVSEDPLSFSDGLDTCEVSTNDCSHLVEMREAFQLAFQKMKPQERECTILHGVFGVNLKAVGERWGVSESRMVQVWTKARGKLAA
jgi:RNA polymerase sigma factor (sigma-70 family)